MIGETRTVHFVIDPALRAYLAWLDNADQEFDLHAFGLFAVGYRAKESEAAARATVAGEGRNGE